MDEQYLDNYVVSQLGWTTDQRVIVEVDPNLCMKLKANFSRSGTEGPRSLLSPSSLSCKSFDVCNTFTIRNSSLAGARGFSLLRERIFHIKSACRLYCFFVLLVDLYLSIS